MQASAPIPVPAGTSTYQLNFSNTGGPGTGATTVSESYDGGLNFQAVLATTGFSAVAVTVGRRLPGFVKLTAGTSAASGTKYSVTLSFFSATGQRLGV